jgi:trigger factor
LFDVPECLVGEELEDRARRIATRFAHRGIDVSKTPIDWKKIFEGERPHAEQGVRRTLILDAIARQEGLEALEAELEEEVRALAEAAKKSPVALRAQLEKDQRIQSVKDHLRRKKALDFIYRNANITRG